MEGKEAIINKIISDAEKKASSIVDNAKYEGNLLIKEAEKWVDDYLKNEREQLKVQKEEIVKRRLTVAELDKRKILLQKKQELISEIIDKVYQQMLKLDKKKYLSFVEKNIIDFSEKDDEIILSSDNVLSKEDLINLDIFKKNNLKINDRKGDFLGGVYLVGAVSDKDLTFKSILDSRKNQMITDIAEKLFN